MKPSLSSLAALVLPLPAFAEVPTDSVPPSPVAVTAPQAPAAVFNRSVNHFPVLRIDATDNLSGVQYLMATFSPVSGTSEFSGENEITVHAIAERSLLDGSAQSGTFSMECRIPRGAAEGSYALRAIKLADANGNISDYAADGSAPAIPMTGTFAFSIQGNEPMIFPLAGDTANPSLDAVAIAPDNLGVATGSGFFDLSLAVQDDVSGIESAEVWMVSPSQVYFHLAAAGGESIIAGDEKSGTLHLRGRIPAGAEAGVWRVARVGLRDRTGKTTIVGLEDGNQLAAASLLVYTTDEDGDGYLEDDLFPNDSTEWADNDQDGIGDNADTDDDNDGMPDAWEIAHGLNPKDASDKKLDSDGDGLSNFTEYLIGTRPNSIDSDGDGIADGDEIHYATNPGNLDSDGDGFLDGTEIAEGFSPTEAGNRPPLQATGELEEEGFSLRFVTRIGSMYRIECTHNFARWEIVEDDIPGDGRPTFHLLSKVTPESGFYRVVETRR